jgi:hypothetical protein
LKDFFEGYKCHDLSHKLVTQDPQVKALQEEWANKVSQNSNTFSQVCESKSQNSQMNFFFLAIGILWHSKFLEQGLGSKPCPNWVLFKPLKMF